MLTSIFGPLICLMIKSILIPTDFTPAAWKAMEVGVRLGLAHNAELTLLHIYPASSKYTKGKPKDSDLEILRGVKEKMEKIGQEISLERGLKISSVVLSGNVEDQLVTFTNDHQFNLIIMGVNSTDEGNFPGSHTIRAIEQCSRPVMVIPNSYSLDD